MKKLLLVISFSTFSFLCYAQTIYTVNTTNDLDDGTCDVIHCSLREAINASNSDGKASNIHFGIIGTMRMPKGVYCKNKDV